MSKRAPTYTAICIYALIDPFTDEVRYVGKSVRPQERLINHCNEQSRTWRTNWLRSLRAKGARPRLRILQELPIDADWQEAERAWIAKGRALGWPLTNCTSGGDGVPDLPPEVRERIVSVWRGRKHRPETLAKIGAASRTRRWTAERTEAMRDQFRGRTFTPEWTGKIRRSLEKLTPDQVAEVRRLIAEGVPQRAIAKRFEVHQGTVSNIKRGLSYAEVTARP